MSQLLKEAQALCCAIEEPPASDQQTKISLMAADLAQKLAGNANYCMFIADACLERAKLPKTAS
jgi:hypothetical protein